jgi:cytochrome c oxidase subunit 1
MSTVASLFRTCSVTGLKVHLPAQKLIIANAVTAIVALLVGGILAILIALSRVPGVNILPAEMFYRLLTAHGTDLLVFWIVFFEVAGLYFGGAVLLNARLAKPGLGWVAFVLMVAGAVIANVIMLAGKADVMFTAYPPMQAHPLFYLGVILFAVGTLLAVFLFMATVFNARKERTYSGSLPLVTYGLFVAAIIAIFTLLAGAVAFVPTFLWSIGLLPQPDPGLYRIVFWGFGHPAQQINLAATVSIWYALASLTVGAKPVNEKLSRFAFLLVLLFINLASMHHILVDPALSTANRIVNTTYFMYLGVVGSMIHGFSIPASVEVAQRRKGIIGLFGWLKKAPWSEPGFAALAVGIVVFGFIGGVSGVIQGNEQLNLIAHNTLRVPGHFHATVVGGTTLAFMGLSYYLVPLMTLRQLVGRKWAQVQPYIFGIGVAILSLGMMWSGVAGVPRRTPDITTLAPRLAEANPSLALIGVGGTIAFIGLVIFIGVAVSTVLFGKRQA